MAFHQRSAGIISLIFLSSHMAVSGMIACVAPDQIWEIPDWFLNWGRALEVLVPSIEFIPRLTKFPVKAWVISVGMWSVVPIASLWAYGAKQLWVPDMIRLRRQPWLLLLAVAAFGLIALSMARLSPELADVARPSFSGRMLSKMTSSIVGYVVYQALIVVGVSFCVAFTARALRIAREI